MREWKPGDVAATTYKGYQSLAFVVAGSSCVPEHPRTAHWHGKSGGWSELHDPLIDRRPLVVIDPEDEENVDTIIDLIWTGNDPANRPATWRIQAALREFANPTPPKPDEPQGLGAVVEDAKGRKWVRADDDDLPWYRASSDDWREFGSVTAVRILSPGVTP